MTELSSLFTAIPQLPRRLKLLLLWYTASIIAATIIFNQPISIVRTVFFWAIYLVLMRGLIRMSYPAWLAAWVIQTLGMCVFSVAFLSMLVMLEPTVKNVMIVVVVGLLAWLSWRFYLYLDAKDTRVLFNAPLQRPLLKPAPPYSQTDH
ncbi:hypothetical protein [Aurantivibrio plasticivorans]